MKRTINYEYRHGEDSLVDSRARKEFDSIETDLREHKYDDMGWETYRYETFSNGDINFTIVLHGTKLLDILDERLKDYFEE